MVEHQLPKLRVASSSLVARFTESPGIRAFLPGSVGYRRDAAFCLGVLANGAGNTSAALEQLRAALPLIDPYRAEIGVFARYLIFELTLADDRPRATQALDDAVSVAETTENPTLMIITLLSQAELVASEDPDRAYELAARGVEVARGWEATRLIRHPASAAISESCGASSSGRT